MAEWLKAPVLKTGNGKPFVGSNPTASATYAARRFTGNPLQLWRDHKRGLMVAGINQERTADE